MRTLLSSILVMGLAAGAVAVGTSTAAGLGPKPASKGQKQVPPIFETSMPFRISEEGTPLNCRRGTTKCSIRGKLGAGAKMILSLVSNDGKREYASTVLWTPGEITFKLSPSVPAGHYALSIYDLTTKKRVSNKIRVIATRTTTEIANACKKNADVDGDGHDALECGGDDCNDDEARTFPGNAEVCDAANLDEDCDPTTYGYRDQDGDGHGDERCCNGTTCGADCDDALRGSSPDSPEVCNLYDDDCDGWIDETVMLKAYRDADKDLYGDAKQTVDACPHKVPRGYVTNDFDCDDANIAKNPRSGCP